MPAAAAVQVDYLGAKSELLPIILPPMEKEITLNPVLETPAAIKVKRKIGAHYELRSCAMRGYKCRGDY